MSNALRKHRPPEPAQLVTPTTTPVMAMLQTRCGCSRLVDILDPAPKTITIEMVRLEGEKAEKPTRTFYHTGKGGRLPNGLNVIFYVEGADREESRIILPGQLSGPALGARPAVPGA